MSIIHDALKKVQRSNPGSTPENAVSAPSQPRPSDPANGPDKVSIPLLVAAICAAIAMLFAALPQIAARKPAATSSPSQPLISTPSAQDPLSSTPAMPAPPSSQTMARALAGAVAVPTVPAQSQHVPVKEPQAHKPVDPNDPLGSVQIEGVLERGGKKTVLINGNIYEEGQTIYGRIIMQISFDELTLIENGRKRVLRIKP